MKKIIIVVALVLLAIAVFAQKKENKLQQLRVLSKAHEAFYFKASKDLIGCDVQVFASDGGVIAHEILLGRKMLVDFYEMESGSYIIRISNKSGFQREFPYDKIVDAEVEELGQKHVHHDGSISYGQVAFYQPGVGR